MIIGNPSIFAIESGITKAYQRLSFRALGFFVLHIGGRSYGVHATDATMLARSFDGVQDRLVDRGRHSAPFATELEAGKIADAFRNALFADDPDESFFGIPLAEFRSLFYTTANSRMWAPDGDEAFDDGSYVLHFDVEERVRLIAFKSGENHLHDANTVSDVWLPAMDFYFILQHWIDAFEAEWVSTPKSSDD